MRVGLPPDSPEETAREAQLPRLSVLDELGPTVQFLRDGLGKVFFTPKKRKL